MWAFGLEVGLMFAVIIIFSHLLKVTFFANKQTQKTSNSSLYIYTLIHQSQRRKIKDISGKHGKKSDEQAKQL